MARRKHGGFELVAAMPWWASILLGLIGYIAIRHGFAWYLESTHDPVLSTLGRAIAAGAYTPIAWAALVAGWFAAIASFIGHASRRKLLDRQTGILSLRQMSWRQFEQLVGEAFRRQGYAIEETGLGGADGGVDLILRRNGQTTLVQCKQWQNRQVGVKVVREMYGLLAHHQAAAVKIVALGDYTPDAQHFAQGKPIELIHGGELIVMVRSLQTTKARARGWMDTPLALGGSMVASLLVIGILSSATATKPTSFTPPPVAIQAAARPLPAPTYRPAATPSPHPQASIYLSDSQDAAALREWKKRNAESMKILEKTTKEMPLR